MSAPHPTAIDTADPAPLMLFKPRVRTAHAHCIPITQTEREVMPIGRALQPETRESIDTRPASATRADRLAEIATLIRLLTYGEMMELAEGLWKAHGADNDIRPEMLPGIWHTWSKER